MAICNVKESLRNPSKKVLFLSPVVHLRELKNSIYQSLPRFVGDHIDRSLVHLVLDGAVQHVERFTGALVQELVQQKREPGREMLWSVGHNSSVVLMLTVKGTQFKENRLLASIN